MKTPYTEIRQSKAVSLTDAQRRLREMASSGNGGHTASDSTDIQGISDSIHPCCGASACCSLVFQPPLIFLPDLPSRKSPFVGLQRAN